MLRRGSCAVSPEKAVEQQILPSRGRLVIEAQQRGPTPGNLQLAACDLALLAAAPLTCAGRADPHFWPWGPPTMNLQIWHWPKSSGPRGFQPAPGGIAGPWLSRWVPGTMGTRPPAIWRLCQHSDRPAAAPASAQLVGLNRPIINNVTSSSDRGISINAQVAQPYAPLQSKPHTCAIGTAVRSTTNPKPTTHHPLSKPRSNSPTTAFAPTHAPGTR